MSSVGEIRKYTDTDGDGKADKREVLFTGFGTRDTHGMYNSFTLMPDGWVYACHGFSTTAKVKGKDGHEVEMQLGQHLPLPARRLAHRSLHARAGEPVRHGRRSRGSTSTRPTATRSRSRNSSPARTTTASASRTTASAIAPHVTRHDHGSTALCGLDVVRRRPVPEGVSRLHVPRQRGHQPHQLRQDRVEGRDAGGEGAAGFPGRARTRGSARRTSSSARTARCTSRTFTTRSSATTKSICSTRGRDKDRGRIWRIVWKGKEGKAPVAKFHRDDFTKATDAELIDDLFHPNLTVRFLAGHQLRLRSVEGKNPRDNVLLAKLETQPDRAASVLGWVAFIAQAGKDPPDLEAYELFVKYAKEPMNKVKPEWLTGHLVRALSSRANWGEGERKLLLDIFKSFDSIHQKRACIEAVIAHPHKYFVQPVLEVLHRCDPADTHLRFAARIALRNCLRDADAWPPYTDVLKLREGFDPVYAEMAIAIPNQKATEYLGSQLLAGKIPSSRFVASAEHIARYGTYEDWSAAIAYFTPGNDEAYTPAHGEALLAISHGLQARQADAIRKRETGSHSFQEPIDSLRGGSRSLQRR